MHQLTLVPGREAPVTGCILPITLFQCTTDRIEMKDIHSANDISRRCQRLIDGDVARYLTDTGDPVVGNDLHDRPQRVRRMKTRRIEERRVRDSNGRDTHLTDARALCWNISHIRDR